MFVRFDAVETVFDQEPGRPVQLGSELDAGSPGASDCDVELSGAQGRILRIGQIIAVKQVLVELPCLSGPIQVMTMLRHARYSEIV